MIFLRLLAVYLVMVTGLVSWEVYRAVRDYQAQNEIKQKMHARKCELGLIKRNCP